MARSFVYDVQLHHPVEKVWKALTDSGQLESWLMKNDFRPEVGRVFQFTGVAAGGSDGVVNGEVLEVAPLQRLVYRWAGGPMMDTKVTWELSPVGQGTHLKATHSGFKVLTWGFVFLVLGSRWKKLDGKYIEALQNFLGK